MVRSLITGVMAFALTNASLVNSALAQTSDAVRTPAAQKASVTRQAQPVQRGIVSPVVAVMNRRIEAIDWDEQPLEAVIEWVQSQGPVNVVVVWRALEAYGVDPDTPITLRMQGVTVRQVLIEALTQVSSDGEIRFRGVGNIIRISTREEFNRDLYVRVYDVSDLIMHVPDFEGPEITLTDEGGQGGQGGGLGGGMGGGFGGGMGGMMGGGGSQSPFSGSEGGEEEEEEESVEERMESIVELIRETIDPDGWTENGGDNTIRAYKRQIVVRAPIEVHEQIGGPFLLP